MVVSYPSENLGTSHARGRQTNPITVSYSTIKSTVKNNPSIINNKVISKDELRADVLGAHLASPWTLKSMPPMPAAVDLPKAVLDEPWPHQVEGVQIPMPKGQRLAAMQKEFYQRVEGDGLGPTTARWVRDVFEWAKQLRTKLFGDTPQVTGLWSRAAARFGRRLAYLHDKKLAHRVLHEVKHGVRIPFSVVPAEPIVAKHNHPDLALRADHVFKALCMQLDECSVQPFDMSKGQRPMGVLSLRWVEKSNPNEVRLTLNGRPENEFIPECEGTIELETHRELRAHYRQGQMYIGFDLHNGFFNQMYCEEDKQWVCFRIHESELKPGHVAILRKRFPTSWVHDYVYFNYNGLVMGLSPSCQQLSRVNNAMLSVWRRFPIKNATWDATCYIDDSMAWVNGTFASGIELALRLLAEQVVLGFSVNLNEKTTIVPTTYYNHIGIVISSTRMRFSLPSARATKMEVTARLLDSVTVVGKPVSEKLVAKFIGQLWSCDIVCFRAVAIMARAMIRTLAVMIRTSEAMNESDPHRLRYILRRVWGGTVTWTVEAQRELSFWLGIRFETLSAPISHDACQKDLQHWFAHPNSGKIAADVKVFAVDTSNTMSGGGEFIRDGNLWRMVNGMAVRLTLREVLTSSTFRELLGVLRLDLAIIPASCKKAVLLLDSQAAVACLLHGSKIKVLQDLVREIFARQLRFNRILWSLWLRRSEDIIVQCDIRSRLVDRHAQRLCPKTFWRANAVAIKLWKRGFQVDACADMHNVQPADSKWKLPFYSRWASPFASATDMLQQNWKGAVHFCNPPFVLLPRVFALLQSQQACAAVVVPHEPEARWFRMLCRRSTNVLFVMRIPLSVAEHGHRIVFVDFAASPPTTTFKPWLSAERLPLLPQPDKLMYRRLPPVSR